MRPNIERNSKYRYISTSQILQAATPWIGKKIGLLAARYPEAKGK
jgi:hypothetical protein